MYQYTLRTDGYWALYGRMTSTWILCCRLACDQPQRFFVLSQWVLYQLGLEGLVKYIDDLLIIAPPGSPLCAHQLDQTKYVCGDLGLPLAMDKVVGPTECLDFLGIELDTSAWTIQLPMQKLLRLQNELERWGRKRACRKRELLSLIGQLAHACKVIPQGRVFLRRMIDLAAKAQKLSHWVCLNEGFCSDLAWWRLFLT